MELFEKQIHNYQLLNQVKIKNYNTDFPYNVFVDGELIITGKTIDLLVKDVDKHKLNSKKGGNTATITIVY
jgi:hypothetical protein